MSVPKGKRTEASTEFLKNARDIEVFIIQIRVNKPKRYSYYYDKLTDIAWQMMNECKMGNSIYAQTQADALQRRRHFKEAEACCQALSSQIEILYYLFKNDALSIGQVQQVAQMIEYEIKLLKGVVRSDKERYKNLPEKLSDI